MFLNLLPILLFNHGFMNHFCPLDQISIEELDIIYKIPHCVPVSAHHKWNFDDLLERMWEYLKLVRMYVSTFVCPMFVVFMCCSGAWIVYLV
jgi:Predicted GTPase